MEFIIKNISFRYSKKSENSLKNISFSCKSGSVIGLAGANGSGKTTLIRVLLGQLVEFEGEYSINTEKIRDFQGNILSRFGIGYAPDSPALDDMLTGFEILSLVADIRGIDKNAFDRDLALFTSSLQLEEWFSTRKCAEYSTGMRKKVSLAIAFLGSQKFTVLDEPTNGLDPLSVFGLKTIISVKKEAGTGSLIASHILDFVEKTANDVLLLKHGTLIYGGSLEGLKKSWPASHSLEEIYCTLFNS
jgi:ABC-type multidrug transport system ATPase subunit